jgi:hypothetical protein
MREWACQAIWDAFGAAWPSHVAPMQKTGMMCVSRAGCRSLLLVAVLTLSRTLLIVHFCFCDCVHVSTCTIMNHDEHELELRVGMNQMYTAGEAHEAQAAIAGWTYGLRCEAHLWRVCLFMIQYGFSEP